MARSPVARRAAASPRRSARTRAYHHGDLQRALVDAARELLREAGPEALTLRGVARRAGVSQAAPYRHFASHRDLVAAVAEDGFRRLHERMLRGAASQRGGRGLQQLAVEYVRFALEYPAEYRVMFGREIAGLEGGESGAALRTAAGEVMALLQGGIERLQQAGAVRPGDPRTMALSAWALVHGIVMLTLDGQRTRAGDQSPEELVRDATSLLMMGMAARPSS